MNAVPWITILTLVPLVGAAVVIGLQREQKQLARLLSLLLSFVSLGLVIFLWTQFNAGSGELQFEEQHEWIPTLKISYHVAADGLSLLMLLLTAIVTPMAMRSWRDGGPRSARCSASELPLVPDVQSRGR